MGFVDSEIAEFIVTQMRVRLGQIGGLDAGQDVLWTHAEQHRGGSGLETSIDHLRTVRDLITVTFRGIRIVDPRDTDIAVDEEPHVGVDVPAI